MKVLSAIHFTMDGLFDVAGTELEDIVIKDPLEDLWPEMREDFSRVTMEMLRAELDELRRRPLQQWPIFWRMISSF
jgi:hypothetical protein